MEITFTGLGTAHVTATAQPAHALGPQGTTALDDGIELRILATAAFDVGGRSSGGQRYLSATFEVRNATASGDTPYTSARQNLTFFAASSASNLSGTAVTRLVRFDNTAADASIALNMRPTHGMQYSPLLNAAVVDAQAADFQAFRESEVDAVSTTPSPAALFPYGFVVRSASGTGRALPASPAPDQFDGRVTFAYRLPLQSVAADDPYQVRILVQAADTTLLRVTESPEEQVTPAAQTPAQRAAALGTAEVATLKGSTYTGTNAVPLCQVRTAGPAAAPTASLGGPC